MSQENVEIVRRVLEEFAATQRLTDDVGPEFVWDMSRFEGWPEEPTYRGEDRFMEFFRTWVDAYDEWAQAIDRVIDAGDDRGWSCGTESSTRSRAARSSAARSIQRTDKPSKPWACRKAPGSAGFELRLGTSLVQLFRALRSRVCALDHHGGGRMYGTGRRSTTLAALAVGLVATLVPAAGAQAATTIGQAPPTDGASVNCGPGVGVQRGVASGTGYTVPVPGGVIARWRTSATGGMAMTVFTGASPTFTAKAESAVENANGVLTTFATRIPVSGGELLGFRLPGAAPGCAFETMVAADAVSVVASAPIGTPTTFAEVTGFRWNIAADIEPDADKDGFGDETQDLCPTQAGTQGPCVQCNGQIATIVGTNLPDAIKGTSGKDVIALLGGADQAKAGSGNDIVCGGLGNDDLRGQTGKDKLFGEKGKDELNGGGGKGDLCNGGKGSDDAKGSCEKERSI
jgi:hemolysin type calcium-binding protein